jgi:WD40 repeat protein
MSRSVSVHVTHMSHTVCGSLVPQDSEPITSLALSPDKHSLVAASRSLTVRHWDWTTGECKRTWKVRRTQRAGRSHCLVDVSTGSSSSSSSSHCVSADSSRESEQYNGRSVLMLSYRLTGSSCGV